MSYVKLGNTCQYDFSMMTSNTKFFPPGDIVYNFDITRMHQYPGQGYDLTDSVGNLERPEYIKTKPEKQKISIGEPYSSKSCCGGGIK